MSGQAPWTWLDAIWIIILAALLLRGFLRGFVQELMELLVLGLALYAAARLYQPFALWVVERLPVLPDQASRALAFGVVVAGILAIGTTLTGMVAHLVRLSPLSWLDSLGGALVGVGKGLVVVAAAVVVLAGLPPGDLRDELSDSRISRQLRAVLPHIWGEVRQAFPEMLPPLPALEGSSTATGSARSRLALGGGPIL
ncbi:MAG: CvpA family protein [Limnochordaceae bacterium]|uniref:CvpA family protein n=1 Tax=Carboxydichorda subterranea TaxID=3109565 RepID=A0ABZ1C193_9FIRM|nr:CvpA family protein [Limnochorda sp. L945t]MBE3597582.1 CvpA family protein [Limnochordaceae bacterium]WRP18704.1 CvpA family protein [Limnochorda sp. L945t]